MHALPKANKENGAKARPASLDIVSSSSASRLRPHGRVAPRTHPAAPLP